MPQFYVVDDLRRGELNIAHFHCLPDTAQAYKALPTANRKALGVHLGADAIDLVQCLPLFPTDHEGEDVLALRFLEFPLWKSDPRLMETAQELVSRLHICYCLFQNCIFPAPDKDKLPRAMRNKYLWPDVPGDFHTAAQWIYVAGAGRLSPAEFKRRFVEASSVSLAPPQAVRRQSRPRPKPRAARPTAGELVHSAASPLPTKPGGRLCGGPLEGAFLHPLVVHVSAFGMDTQGNYHSLQVTPWEFHLLIQRSKERFDQNKMKRGIQNET